LTDVFSKSERSRVMAAIRGKNTKPEIAVRKLLHAMGIRFRLHRKDLPGRPDIVLPRFRKVILVHGCFWHGHGGCSKARRPKSNADFWNLKIDRNIERDRRTTRALRKAGWGVLTLWTCELTGLEKTERRLKRFLAETE